MKYYPGDRIATITTGSGSAAVQYQETRMITTHHASTIDHICIKSGSFYFNGSINEETLSPVVAEVTISKLVHRPWYNHLRAIIQPIMDHGERKQSVIAAIIFIIIIISIVLYVIWHPEAVIYRSP